jgi:hypothetical protein
METRQAREEAEPRQARDPEPNLSRWRESPSPTLGKKATNALGLMFAGLRFSSNPDRPSTQTYTVPSRSHPKRHSELLRICGGSLATATRP